MDRTVFCRIFSVIISVAVVQLMSPVAAAPSNIKCHVTAQTDGSFMYELSESPTYSPACSSSWAHRNNTVVARDSKSAPNYVQRLTNRSITLRSCQDYMKFRHDCQVVQEAVCTVNCSELSSVDMDQPIKVNSTMTCIILDWCPDPLTFWLIVFVGVILIVSFSMYCLWKIVRCRRGQPAIQTTSYTSADGEIKTVV